jgi:hypothetical protein
MSEKKSVDEILKEIVIKAVDEYINEPVNPNLPKTNTKKNIAMRTGIAESTLMRYSTSNNNSYPNLVEVMEILRVTNKRELLIEFGKQSNCQSAQFIKEHYPNYIKSHQIISDSPDSGLDSQEMLRIINEHQFKFDKKQEKYIGIIALVVGLVLISMQFKAIEDSENIVSILSQINEELKRLK